LFDAFARLGRELETIPPPPGAVFARSTAALPPPLRHLASKDELPPQGGGIAATETLKIAFPLDGSAIDLGLAGGPTSATPLALKALGGAPPLTWLVNGAPVLRDQLRRNTAWVPDGAGFIRLTVMDSNGATDSVSVRLE
jgi:penicillin-binding protein 1C